MQKEMPDKHSHQIPALDGLRGVAVLLVIGWHYFIFLRPWFPGWEGVDLFFVLSGYLITGRLMQTKGLPNYFSRFYRNRLLRIVPLYYVVVIFYLVTVDLFVRRIHLPLMAIYLDHWKSFFLFTANWTFIFFGVPRDISLVPLWSVAVEAQYYLVWPVLIVLTSSKLRLKLLPALILLVFAGRAIAWFLHPLPVESIYFNSLFRFDCFLAGALLYQLHHSKISIPLPWIKVAVFVLLALQAAGMLAVHSAYFGPFFELGGYTLNALLFACLVHLATQLQSGIFYRFLHYPFLRFCGKISYGLYLVHLPILLNIGTRLPSPWPASVGISLVLSFLISTLSFRYFESYFLRLKNYI